MDEATDERNDVLVIGGGAAGLAAALALARAGRSVLVVDAGQPRNARAGHVHSFLTREGTPPAELLAAGRAEVTGHGGRIVTGTAASAVRKDDGFVVTLDDGRDVEGRRLVVTTGLVDELPDLPGLADRFGRDVLHCPYCHGREVAGRRIGVLGGSPLAPEQANLWRQWSPHVTLLLGGAPAPDPATAERLAARRIAVVDEPVTGLDLAPDDGSLAGVRLASGGTLALDVLVVAPRFTARAAVLESLGVAPEPVVTGGYVIGSQIPADATGATAVPGVWVAGNVADLRAQVITAAAAGAAVAGAVNADLVAEDTRLAVEAYRRGGA